MADTDPIPVMPPPQEEPPRVIETTTEAGAVRVEKVDSPVEL